jgi:hypothetical protein
MKQRIMLRTLITRKTLIKSSLLDELAPEEIVLIERSSWVD